MICDLVFVSERHITADIYERAYRSLPGYRAMVNSARRTAAGVSGIKQLWRYKRRAIERIESEVAGRRLLDVGCGPGQFLLILKQRGWEVSGVELASEAVAEARSHGLTVFHGEIGAFSDNCGERFHALTCFEVLEHIVEPIEFLRSLRRLIATDGCLVCTVPNVDDPYCLQQQDPASMPPVHLNFFNRRSLRFVLEQSGFNVVEFYTLVVPTNSARRCLGRVGYLASLPWLLVRRLLGTSDGTTLFVLARPATALPIGNSLCGSSADGRT